MHEAIGGVLSGSFRRHCLTVLLAAIVMAGAGCAERLKGMVRFEQVATGSAPVRVLQPEVPDNLKGLR